MQFQFIGRVGKQVAKDLLNWRGFAVHAASIETSGSRGLSNASTPIELVAVDMEENSLKEGDVYTINCKMIGSNKAELNQLHFTSAARMHLGDGDDFLQRSNDTFVNKVAVTAYGTIVSKFQTDEDWGMGVYPLIVTLKSADMDPVSQIVVEWLSKHHVLPRPNGKNPNEIFNVGQKVQISGMVMGYDNTDFMWHSEVSSIAICKGQIPGARVMMEREFQRNPRNALNAHRYQGFVRRYNAKHGDPQRIRLMNKGGVGAWRGRQIVERKQ
ncbi:Hypothetical protein MELLADRAFT_86699 [Melampsora larici-populina 98AG31]|uniref:Uncharacterized protein n=1 Tax=Melampsora larici-populina (strain 98AG31 / pathotype 3-4-7) TaxID=747676 RepID=F4R327_MELLP|nr:Hypothetical protein MELLADRAFT_86699 [Melampsora larici-populina 98AG31]EGG13241.1 Hypothetical protein MELLADRAFT_86699 [Melampsora larici-populina 98AG31]